MECQQFSILLTTLNIRYHHTAFGLRYLYANLGELKPQAKIVEFVVARDPHEIVEDLLKFRPRIIGFGVYIWNTNEILRIVQILKAVSPEITIILGGPEISHETQTQALYEAADFVIQGEGDFAFRELCLSLLNQENSPSPREKLIAAKIPEISKLNLPYEFYTDEDLANRTIYVEASRGCPFRCEYCLSSLDKSVRPINLEIFLEQMSRLLDRGARQFKFVDRTFNLSIDSAVQILNFFLERIELGLFLHFEMVPDRLPEEIRQLLTLFPKGSLQFEIGIQTLNPVVERNVSRRQNHAKIAENLDFLRNHTKVHTHVDLIGGLPGETLESFAQGFDHLVKMSPDEVQVGILKRLKGTPISRHDREQSMVYGSHSPFEVLSTKQMSFAQVQGLKRFAKAWDIYGNSGIFLNFKNQLIANAPDQTPHPIFSVFWRLTEFIFLHEQRLHALSLNRQFELAFEFVTTDQVMSGDQARECLRTDFARTKHQATPHFLKDSVSLKNLPNQGPKPPAFVGNKRQQIHLN